MPHLAHSTCAEAVKTTRAYLLRAEGKKALRTIRRAYRRWPHEFEVAFTYAQILGDTADLYPPGQRRQMQKQSVRILLALSRTRSGKTNDQWWRARRHYLNFTGQHKKNYELGLSEVRKGNRKGYLSQAFGAILYAQELVLRNQIKRAERWAVRGKKAMEQMFRIDPPQFNRYLHYAVALGILGKYSEAETAIREAARLAGKSPEAFDEISRLVSKFRSIRGESAAKR